MESIKFLLSSVKHLGLRQGYRYWKIYLAVKRDPSLLDVWIENCDREARRLEFFRIEAPLSEGLRSWANTLRKYGGKSSLSLL